MYKKLLAQPTNNPIQSEETQLKSTQTFDVHLKYHEILCPKTGKPLKSSNCSKCIQKKEYFRKHELGLTLSTTICTWSDTE